MSKITDSAVQVGTSGTATQNITLRSNVDGTFTVARGNVGATTQDILTIDANGLVTMTQGKQLTLGTVQAATSGTSRDFTGVPTWVKRITVSISALSTNGASPVQIQIGPVAGVETTGYVSASLLGNTGVNTTAATAGFLLEPTSPAPTSATVRGGQAVLTLLDSATNTWVFSSNLQNATPSMLIGAGTKALAGALERVRLTTVNGTDTFDAGSVNILYEG